jgi:thymidylate synthase
VPMHECRSEGRSYPELGSERGELRDGGDRMKFRNAEAAFLAKLAEVDAAGSFATVRGSTTKELLAQTVTIERPLERCITLPHRNNNVFAAVYETLWVLAGRNDIADLCEYLPRARDFSDDGTTWRGGYGPRLRRWNGVDQLTHLVELLRSDSTSRRAVIALFDPDRDLAPSLDIPCTNWLNVAIRDGALHLNVAIRSNDLMWGFSGINTFEWSVLQEMLAHWLGVAVGPATYFIGSLHLYEHHFPRVAPLLSANPGPRAYDIEPARTRFGTPLADLDATLERWFDLEAQCRSGSVIGGHVNELEDPLLSDFLHMVDGYWQHRRNPAKPPMFEQVVDPGLRTAAREYVCRAADDQPAEQNEPVPSADEIDGYLRALHRLKTETYGDSWKRRGEQMSIMANVARKIDRLERLGQHLLDRADVALNTVVDLLVYSVKYESYLHDVQDTPGAPGTWSDGVEGFEHLLLATRASETLLIDPAVHQVMTAFVALESSVQSGPDEHRLALVQTLSRSARALLMAIAGQRPRAAYEAFRDAKDGNVE